uniref:probable membrane-associated kinase regulator 2 n=1 Tax=Erigeron canadensis TaxID=72917 RepID=UPI001CB8E453|nr:probable membrane-associated kinase regulator 2 [Erigeron canadensis]
MDAFSLLRYWRSNGGSDTTPNANVTTSTTATTTTIVTGVSTQTSDTGSDDNDNDHGPFFDLELSLHNENDKNENDEDSDGSEEDDVEDVNELKFALVSSSSGDSTTDDVNVSVSPSDDLFFKGGFVAVATDDDDSGVQTTSFGGTHSSKPSPRASLLKSATKLRVMMLKLKKMKISENTSTELKQQKDEQSNFIEEVPIVSLFKRHNSTSKTQKKLQNDVVESQIQQHQQQTVSEDISVNAEEKKFSKEAMQRYLRKVKPLYVRVSKRYGEKLKFSGQLAIKQKMSPSSSPATEERKELSTVKEGNLEVSEPPLLSGNGKGLKQGNLPAGLRVVCKHLAKSRSASTAVVAAAPPGMMSSKRRDDSLLQQQDGIQSAILHCKRSFKASRDSDCSSSESAPAYGKCGNDSISDTAAEVRETTVEDEMKKS